MGYVKIVRPLNLLLLLLIQGTIKYGLFEPLGVQVSMGVLDFSLLVIATLSIAAAGNVINDIQDVTIDTINKPQEVLVGRKISEKNAYNLYIFLNIVGVGTGFILANRVGHPGLAAVFIAISILLYAYATYLKSVLIVGNLLVSLLVASSLLVCIMFDVYPVINSDQRPLQILVSKVVVWYALAAFYLNLIREITKDIADVNGDKKGDRLTIPIVLGRSRTVNIVFVMGVLGLLILVWFCYGSLYHHRLVVGYFVFAIGGPLLYYCIRAWNAENEADYKRLSSILKIVMFTGVCSLYFFAEILIV